MDLLLEQIGKTGQTAKAPRQKIKTRPPFRDRVRFKHNLCCFVQKMHSPSSRIFDISNAECDRRLSNAGFEELLN